VKDPEPAQDWALLQKQNYGVIHLPGVPSVENQFAEIQRARFLVWKEENEPGDFSRYQKGKQAISLWRHG
jgi:hypothetical protein